jgi:Xaa-Pro dipeptidase
MLLNKERMLQKMEEFKLDVIIASHPENVSYLADFQSHLPYMYRFLNVESFALFPRRADIAPTLIVSKSDISWAARYPSWMPEVYTFGNDGYTVYPGGTLSEGETRFKEMLDDHDRHAAAAGNAIVKALKDKGLDKGRIGLDQKNIYPETMELITQGLPQAEILDAFELIRVIRMVKTPEELERITEVGLLNERAAQSVLDRLAEGVSEEELLQHFLECTAKEGAVFEFWNTASGTQSSMNIMSYGHHNPRARYRLRKGDLFRYDGGSIYNKYHSDAGGCAVLGTPNERLKICYRAIEVGMEKALELLRPGVLPSALYAQVITAVEKAGITDYARQSYFCGHGIGIEARDYPIFSKPMKARSPFLPGGTYDLPVEEGMVISIEVPYYELGLGGIQVEYTLLVTRDGCENLYPHQRELVVR